MSLLTKPTEDFPTEDYLDEDKPLRHNIKKQNFCVISMLTPNTFPENKREQYKNQKILGIKVRGVYEEYAEAAARAEQLQKIDKFHNIFVGDVGKWLPFDVDASQMGSEDQVYREKSLNKYMKSYKDALHEEETEEKSRKDNMLHGANVVTGKYDSTVNQQQKPVDDTVHETDTEAQTVRTPKDTTSSELKQNAADKAKLQATLDETKSSLAGLEDKLSTINDMYAKLKSN